MSADNGIYILKTTDEQYRVTTAQAIENIFYDRPRGQYNLGQLVRYFGSCRFTTSKEKALSIAQQMDKTYQTEYGIKIFSINMKWGTVYNKGVKEIEEHLATLPSFYHRVLSSVKQMNEMNYLKPRA